MSRLSAAGAAGAAGALGARCLLLIVVVSLSACVSLPTSGRVVGGGAVGGEGGRAALRVTATGPIPGASPEEVVQGFLAAVAGLDDYAVAQEFLAPRARATWRPDERTLIHSGTTMVEPGVGADEDEDPAVRRLDVLATVEARIDDSGERTQEAVPVQQRQELTLTRVAGEWRISTLPPGVLVSNVDADRVLSPYALYFPDQSRSYLVPDVRWFPQLESSATPLVRALLGGPTAPLLAAVDTSSVPTGTRLALGTVRVEEDGSAVVDLTEDVLAADDADLALLRDQLDRTLQPVPGVSRVELRVENDLLEESAPPGGQVPNLPVDPVVDNTLHVLGLPPDQPDIQTAAPPVDVAGPDRPVAEPGSVVLRIGRDGPEVVPGTESLSALVATGLAVSGDGSFAGLDAARTTLVLQRPGGLATAVVSGADLTTPSFDPQPFGWVWTATAATAQDDRPRVLVSGNEVDEVEVGWLRPGDTVRALRVSRDGARVVLVVAEAGGPVRVHMAGVSRDASGKPVALSGSTLPVAVGLTDAVDVAWVTSDDVVVLGRTGEESLRPVLAQVGGTTSVLAPAPQAATISSGSGERNIVIGTGTGTILTRSGSQWVDAATQGVAPAFPG